MRIEGFKMATMEEILSIGTIFAILNLSVTPMPSIKHQVWTESALRFGRCRLKNFKIAALAATLNVGNGTNLAVLNLNVSPVPPIKFQLNPTYRLGAHAVSRFSSWPPWRPSWKVELSNSKSPYHPKCRPQSLGSIRLTVREQTWFEYFLNGHCGGHLGFRNGTILAIPNLYVAPISPIKFQLNPTYGLGEDVILKFSRCSTWRSSWIPERNAPWAPMPPTKFGLNLTGFRSRCGFKIFKITTWAAILAIRTVIF